MNKAKKLPTAGVWTSFVGCVINVLVIRKFKDYATTSTSSHQRRLRAN